MKITFVARRYEQLPVSLLSAIAKREGYQVDIAFSLALFQAEILWLSKLLDDRNDVIQAIKDQKPDVLAFSVITIDYQWMLGIAKEAKELFPNVKVIFGGVHSSAIPERILSQHPYVDYVVVGEGDIAFVELLRAIGKGGPTEPIVNTRFRANDGKIIRGVQAGFLQDLDSLPGLDKTIWEDHVNVGERYMTMASRGCPYRCTFCFNNFYAQLPDGKKGKYVRVRSVEHMINELVLAKKRYNIKYVEFFDDVFTVYKPWVHDFLLEYKKKIKIPFGFLSHPHYMDDDVMKWLKEAGAEWAQMGIQSMDEEYKAKSLLRYEDSREIVKALESAHKYGLKIKVDHMFGLPGEPPEAQEKGRALYLEQSPTRITTYWTCFLPGTDIMKQGLADGILTQEQADRINDGLMSYSFGDKTDIKDKQLLRFYGGYELLFKIFPLLPDFLKKRLTAKHLEPLSNSSAMRWFAKAMDVLNCVITQNPDYTSQMLHYKHHTINFLLKKLGLKRKPVNKKINLDALPVLEPKKEVVQEEVKVA